MKKVKLPIQAQMRMDQNYHESKKVHVDELSEEALLMRIKHTIRAQKEKDRLYDLENPKDDVSPFQWED